MKTVRVAFLKRDQNWNRNILCHQYDSVRLVRTISLSRIIFAVLKRLGIHSGFWENTYFGPSFPTWDLLHTWRMICFTRRPWIVTTSVGLPFGWPKKFWPYGLARLARPNCKRILVNSRHALDWQRKKLDGCPGLSQVILAKTEILPTPQSTLVRDVSEKETPSDQLVITMVGHHFFRKGGPALIEAAERISRDRQKLHVNIVSCLKPDEFSGVTERQVSEWSARLSATPWITWHKQLPNHEVLDLFRRSHVGVLLSFAEAYGYSVIEAQACGCCTITTDIGALPELNTEECGWLVSIRHLNLNLYSKESLSAVHEAIVEQLIPLLSTLADEPTKCFEKGAGALRRIAREHDPAQHKERLEQIYHACTSRKSTLPEHEARGHINHRNALRGTVD